MVRSITRLIAAGVFALPGLAVSTGETTSPLEAAERPNVLLLVSDDQRPDTIHALGNEIIRTPNLDRLVASGTAFTRATCANPICTPSRAEILSGSNSFRNGVLDFGRGIKPELPTMPRWFSEAGYRTLYVGKWHNDGVPVQRGYSATRGLYRGGGGKFYKPQVDWAGRPVTGYRGWIFQDDTGKLFPERGVGLTPDISAKFADAAVSLIEESADNRQPFFLHVNFTAPHDPLLLPPGWEQAYSASEMPLPKNFAVRHAFDHGNFDGRDEKLFAWPRTPKETRGELAAYYAVISHMDAQIGRILDALNSTGQDKETIVVFTSDHGLAVGSHGLRGKQSMYEHTIGVPLLLSGPGVPAGDRRAAQCYLRDLFPTLADLAGITSPGDRIDGRSLGPVLRGEASEVHPFVTGYFRNYQRMIRDGDWKFIEYPDANVTQLFDLSADPHELNNLSSVGQHSGRRNELAAKLHDWLAANGDPLARQ
ncbi:MAG: sulfatase-like hydrolase/transferase [Planctomycetota bacterium]|jgi:arylsulfatase A-like enzyme